MTKKNSAGAHTGKLIAGMGEITKLQPTQEQPPKPKETPESKWQNVSLPIDFYNMIADVVGNQKAKKRQGREDCTPTFAGVVTFAIDPARLEILKKR